MAIHKMDKGNLGTSAQNKLYKIDANYWETNQTCGQNSQMLLTLTIIREIPWALLWQWFQQTKLVSTGYDAPLLPI